MRNRLIVPPETSGFSASFISVGFMCTNLCIREKVQYKKPGINRHTNPQPLAGAFIWTPELSQASLSKHVLLANMKGFSETITIRSVNIFLQWTVRWRLFPQIKGSRGAFYFAHGHILCVPFTGRVDWDRFPFRTPDLLHLALIPRCIRAVITCSGLSLKMWSGCQIPFSLFFFILFFFNMSALWLYVCSGWKENERSSGPARFPSPRQFSFHPLHTFHTKWSK